MFRQRVLSARNDDYLDLSRANDFFFGYGFYYFFSYDNRHLCLHSGWTTVIFFVRQILFFRARMLFVHAHQVSCICEV